MAKKQKETVEETKVFFTDKMLYNADEQLFSEWAKEFVDQYPGDTGWMKCHDMEGWLIRKAASCGYSLRYDNALFDFQDFVFDEIDKRKK